jgi:hypothetical protein
MFDFIKRLFGEGRVRLEGVTSDGRTFNGKLSYIGALHEKDIINHFAEMCMVEKGIKIIRARIVAIAGKGYEEIESPVTYKWYTA